MSFYFPPFDMIGCVRPGKTAAYLSRLGHEVRVVTAREQGLPFRSLPVELPPGSVTATDWVGPRRLLDKVSVTAPAPSKNHGLKARARRFLRGIAYLPDPQVGWIPFAYRAGAKLIQQSRPDVIIASSGPPSSLIVASLLSKRFRIPWIADLRDLWTDNQNYPFPRWRRPLDRFIERRVLSSASGLVTVSEPLAKRLRDFHLPVEVVLNGYDDVEHQQAREMRDTSTTLRIVYTGIIYPQQSPEPLFKAIAMLGVQKTRVSVTFIGPPEHAVFDAPSAVEVRDQIKVLGMVSRADALAAQAHADVLLHLLWNDADHTGVYGAKIFEYLRSRRPVLAVGADTGNVAARLVTERGAGIATFDPAVIAEKLREWVALLDAGRPIPEIPLSASAGLSRRDQTKKLEAFVREVLATEKGAA